MFEKIISEVFDFCVILLVLRACTHFSFFFIISLLASESNLLLYNLSLILEFYRNSRGVTRGEKVALAAIKPF